MTNIPETDSVSDFAERVKRYAEDMNKMPKNGNSIFVKLVTRPTLQSLLD